MDGVLIINKPKGFTSHDVVNVLRKTLNEKKIGHTGTLDPNATGVLPILIGKATKISKYLIEHDKEYIATIVLGEQTDTGDIEGKIIKTDINVLTTLEKINQEKIRELLKTFIGKQEQIPPIYSAIKINGKKAYEYARQGQAIKIEPRNIEIYNIELLAFANKEIQFKVLCSKGTYIRTLCEDIAKKLGTIGYMKDLERTRINEFNIDNAITIEDVKNNLEKTQANIIKLENVFQNYDRIELDNRKTELLLNGVLLTYNLQNGVYKVYNNNKFIGIGTITNNLLKRDIIL